MGTPDYIAPEVFERQGYTESVDWWSVGAIMFEMLVGYAPFASETPKETCHKVVNWKKYFKIPAEANLSKLEVDLITKLMAPEVRRLGRNGVQEIKAHPYFQGIDWSRLGNTTPPYRPTIKSSTDTSNFDEFKEESKWAPAHQGTKGKRIDPRFIGFTYKKTEPESDKLKSIMNLFQEVEAQRELKKRIEVESSEKGLSAPKRFSLIDQKGKTSTPQIKIPVTFLKTSAPMSPNNEDKKAPLSVRMKDHRPMLAQTSLQTEERLPGSGPYSKFSGSPKGAVEYKTLYKGFSMAKSFKKPAEDLISGTLYTKPLPKPSEVQGSPKSHTKIPANNYLTSSRNTLADKPATQRPLVMPNIGTVKGSPTQASKKCTLNKFSGVKALLAHSSPRSKEYTTSLLFK